MTEAALAGCPWKGLVPYDAEDAAWFFGRDAERRNIAANLMGNRLTLLYGASGVGKSSVLRAGVLHHLRRLALSRRDARGEPDFAVAYVNDWRDEPVAGLLEAVTEAVREINPTASDLRIDGCRLDNALARLAKAAGGRLFVILDQFEEYFLYHGDDRNRHSLAALLPGLICHPGIAVNFLIAMREDSLAVLDRFKGEIPGLFDNYLRVEHLRRDQARLAISEPLKLFNESAALAPISMEPTLVDAVLDEVRTGAIVIDGSTETSARPVPSDADRIETPFLQLVMTTLWERAHSHLGQTELTRALLQAPVPNGLGGADSIVRRHLDRVMDKVGEESKKLAGRIFPFLVSASGTKFSQRVSDLAQETGASTAEVADFLDRMATGEARVLRSAGTPPGAVPRADRGNLRYEIFHDVLALAVRDWQRRYSDEQKRLTLDREAREAEARAAAAEAVNQRLEQGRRLLQRALFGLAAVLVLAVGALVYAWWQKGVAQSSKELAHARELAASSQASFEEDPERSILLALAAVRAFTPAVPVAEAALQAVVQRSKIRMRFTGHGDSLTIVSFSPDGQRIATESDGNTARILDAATGRELIKLEGHEASVTSVSFSPDGQRIATGSEDYTARIWDVATGRELLKLEGHDASVTSVSFSPDGQRIATASDDKTARIWNAATGRELLKLNGHDASVTSVSFSPDGQRIATGSEDYTARIWDAATGRELLKLDGHENSVSSVSFSPDGQRIATGSLDNTARIWDAATGRELLKFDGHEGYVTSVSFSPDGQRIATGGSDDTARIWDAATGRELLKLDGRESFVTSVSFSPDGQRLATGSFDKTARIWDAATGEKLLKFTGAATINAVAYEPHNTRFAIATGNHVELYAASLDELIRIAKTRVTRPLSNDECREYLHSDKCAAEP